MNSYHFDAVYQNEVANMHDFLESEDKGALWTFSLPIDPTNLITNEFESDYKQCAHVQCETGHEPPLPEATIRNQQEDNAAARARDLQETSVIVNSRKVSRVKCVKIRLTRAMISQHFHLSMEDAATAIGIGRSTMKYVCRKLGVNRWPFTNKGKTKCYSIGIEASSPGSS
mmetsp:Transcript_317/g.684  ORF Transcript_317/g.684 Transcript_317/m.684 type:complete len:171 (-) Transcript_317:103-615(-)